MRRTIGALGAGMAMLALAACGDGPSPSASAAPSTAVPAVQTAVVQQNASAAATQAARLAAVVAPAVPATAAPSGPSEADPDSWEYRLATLQAGRQIAGADPLVGQFKDQLDELVPKCLDDRQHLADYTVRTRQQLAQQGIQDTYLRILVSANATIRAGSLPIRCEELFDAYAKLRMSGVSVVGLLR